ncbi:S8 family peptidase [Pontibacter fetidus]|uniref:S8 family peptidase n=1 Tax=Pontibacter fetidus TaxID=2700082 RepID=A0A6B2H3Z9_9BACT|nr:S8 family peptidase [Pontibacter fetidus]NDK55027.1 S8 family peptidase [Pontibacter fetidus]
MKNTLQIRNTMRSVLFGTAIVAASFTFTSCDTETVDAVATEDALQQNSQNGAVIPGKYIIVFKQGNERMSDAVTHAQSMERARQMGVDVFKANNVKDFAIERAYGKALVGVVANLTPADVEKLRNDDRVAYIEPDRIVMLAKPGTGGGGSTGEEVPYGVTRVGSASGAGKTAWVIDTGIDLDHPDLNVDVARSVTMFTSGRDAGSADDGNGHGTHVAGTIGAKKGNGIGVVGVAYDATVVAVKVLDSRGSGSYSGVIAGVDYVAANGKSGDAANMSLGGPTSDALDQAVLNAAGKGIKFAIAAGNESAHANTSSPARVNHANVYTVSAMDINNKFASFSNYGNPPVDYCAPGVSIKSTWKGGAYNTISGTSMASPHVAGLLLLGNISTDGYVTGDPDGNADPIAHN